MTALRALPNSHWFRIEQQSISGTPDCLGTIRGLFIAIEFKSSAKSKVTELQKYELSCVASTGSMALVLFPANWDQYYQMLENYATTGEIDLTYVPRDFH